MWKVQCLKQVHWERIPAGAPSVFCALVSTVPQVPAALTGTYIGPGEGGRRRGFVMLCLRTCRQGALSGLTVPGAGISTVSTTPACPRAALKCWGYKSLTRAEGLLQEFSRIFVTSTGARGQDLFFNICSPVLTGIQNPTGRSSSGSLTSFHVALCF